jgi:hypothetical protein
MHDVLWNIFLETGSIDAFLDYRNYMDYGCMILGEVSKPWL